MKNLEWLNLTPTLGGIKDWDALANGDKSFRFNCLKSF